MTDRPRNAASHDAGTHPIGFLEIPEPGAGAQELFDQSVAEVGWVMNAFRMWARRPEMFFGLFDLMQRIIDAQGLDQRRRGILITACASTLGDSSCSIAWGTKLSAAAGADIAASVVRGDDEGLTSAERALARWARKVTRNPNAIDQADVQELRDAGFADDQIFDLTVFVALRIAFSTVNDALGPLPDAAYLVACPEAVRDAVTFGRPIADAPPGLTGDPLCNGA